MIPKLIVKGAKKAQREIATIDKNRVKQSKSAVVKVAREKIKILKKEMRAGAPGGKQLKGWRETGKFDFTKTGLKKKRGKPLNRLAKHVSSFVTPISGGIRVEAGFVRKGGRGTNVFINLAELHQKGFESTVTEKKRRYFAAIAKTSLPAKSKFRKFFFIRKSTKKMVVPPRPIIDPFWDKHSVSVVPQVKAKYRELMKA